MDEFLHRDRINMSSNETTKIEPTLIVKDAAATPAEQSETAAAAGEAKIDTVVDTKIDTFDTKIEAKVEVPPLEATDGKADEPKELPTVESPKLQPLKIEKPFELSTSQAPSLPPAPQLDPVVVPFRKPEPGVSPAPTTRSTRFALLAACVAIAASFGAIGGSLGVAKFGPMLSSAPPAVMPVSKEHVADEVKALKESVAQLRTATKTLSENFSALKTTVTTASTQNTKIAETLERIEKSQSEQRKTAALAAPETTGSIGQKQAAPMVLGDPPTTLKPLAVQGWVLRRVYDGAALIEGRDGIVEVEPGMITPGLGRIEAIKRQDGRWVVVTSRGLIVGR
jgi:hypothetical protein